MAGDWIKIEVATPDKPEVAVIADALKIDPDAVVGKLLRVWAWADMNSVDGNGITVTESFLDRLTHRKGFASAMRKAGWLTGENGCLSFPGFDRHNGKTAKERAESNRRMAKSRAGRNNGCGSVAEKAQQKAQPEKRREEKNTASIDAAFSGDGGGIDDQAVELAGLHPKRSMTMPVLRAAAAAIARHGFEVVAAGVRGYAAAVAEWTPAERSQFVKNPEVFFAEDLWNQPQANWPSRTAARTATSGNHRAIHVGGRKPSGIMTFDDEP